MIEHSPGDWKASGRLVYASPHDDLVAMIVYQPNDKIIANHNAHLIAKAHEAPHECSDAQCPGNVNRRKLEACASLFCAATKLLAEYDYGTAMASALHGNAIAQELFDNLRTEVFKALE